MSSGVSSSSSSSINTTRGFEGVTSFTMIESSSAFIKTKKIVEVTCYLHSKEVDVFI
jgi:hypothetical protein